MYGIEVTAPSPAWAESILIEGQSTIDAEIQRVDAEISEFVRRKELLLAKRTASRQPLRLLFDIGTGLEDIVLSVFEELGAIVRRPDSPGMEDGWITVHVGEDVFQGVLEVKGTRSRQFKEDGLRQLGTWINRGIELEQRRYKGLFVGNADIGTRPERRKSPFSAGFASHAELHSFAAITSTDLFRVLQENRAGALDRETFWRELFETDGVYIHQPHRAAFETE